jgi:hypothetical protein
MQIRDRRFGIDLGSHNGVVFVAAVGKRFWVVDQHQNLGMIFLSAGIDGNCVR